MGEFHFSPRPNRAAEIGWRPWSEEAFQEAKSADRPILLSISAVWCHWCHVMDETTYSIPEVIEAIKEAYVPVRVDNDVRPDINQRYNMGGWPTTAFLTPEGDVLTGATYLPPDQMLATLNQVADVYRTRKPEIVARVLEGRQRAQASVAAAAGPLTPKLVDDVIAAVEQAYDPRYGGFGTSPKFPHTDALALLAEQSIRKESPRLMEMARHTLEAMAEGGTYDHVEGGFFRYSTTQDWSVPHFEKMLEDHAGLVAALALTGMDQVLDDTTGYLDRVLRDPKTGLYGGSQDADEAYYALDKQGRESAQAPAVDGRVYSGWNAALAAAYLEADRLRGRPRLKDEARALLERLFGERYHPGRGLEHTEGISGQLGDQAWGLLAAVRAYGAGLGESWLERARELADHAEKEYGDPRLGGYFDRAAGQELGRLGDRVKPLLENSVLAIGLYELDCLVEDPAAPYSERARRALEAVASLPRQYGLMAAIFARAADRVTAPHLRVATGSEELTRVALAAEPNAVIAPGDERAVVCVGTRCLEPATSAEDLRRNLEMAAGLAAG